MQNSTIQGLSRAIGAACIWLFACFSGPAAAETILERVLAMTPSLIGLFVNVAENAFVPGLFARAGIDGSVTTRLSGLNMANFTGPVTQAAETPSVALHHLNTTAFSAINAGDTIIRISANFSVGDPQTQPGAPPAQGFGDIATALAAIGSNAAASGAGAAPDVTVRRIELSTPGTTPDATLIVANLAASVSDVTGAVLTNIEGTSAHVGNLTTTAGGVINSGAVAVGLRNVTSDIGKRITGND